MPPLWGDLPLQGEVPSVAEFVRASSSRSFDVEPEMVVLARKRSRSARPLSRLGLKERVLYRGLTNLVSDRTTIPSRTDDAYKQFEGAPLAVDDVAYVLKTDVAAYYEYIDHDRLTDDVPCSARRAAHLRTQRVVLPRMQRSRSELSQFIGSVGAGRSSLAACVRQPNRARRPSRLLWRRPSKVGQRSCTTARSSGGWIGID